MTPDPLERLAAKADTAGIFLDFDGTLSEIVALPHEARPAPGALPALEELARAFQVVAIVSGRTAHELVRLLGPGLELWGLHGAEVARNGSVELSPAAAVFADLMSAVYAEASRYVLEAGLEGALVEDKGVIVTLHWRAARNRAHAESVLRDLAGTVAREHGLAIAEGKMALELRPPVAFSKRSVIEERSQGLTAAAFAGDDVVDLPAFDALDLASDRLDPALRIAVGSSEAPPELIARADIVVEGPSGMVRLLENLARLVS